MKEDTFNIIRKFNASTARLLDFFTIKNNVYKNLISLIIFLSAFICVFNYIGLFDQLNQRPRHIHISAQTQRASIALNYYKTDMNFFKPRIQRYLVGEGITGVEFPIIYYTAAIFYKLFGFNEIYLRLLSLIIVMIGFYFFYKLCNTFIENNLTSAAMTMAISLSPVLLIYIPNFMPDAPSMALHLASWYFFFAYLNTGENSKLRWFVFFSSMAVLIKAIAIMVFIVIGCIIILDKLTFFRSKEKKYLFDDHTKVLKAVFSGVLIAMSWYVYAWWLSKHYNYESFALRPVMINTKEELDKVMEFVINLWVPYYHSYEGYVLMVSTFAVVLLFIWYANRLLVTITLLYLIGSCFYIYFFLNQFRDHDYYIIALLPTLFFSLLTFCEMLIRTSKRYFPALSIVLFVVLFFNVKESVRHAKKMYWQRTSEWVYWWSGNYNAYEDLEPKLRKAGIKREDKFISAFDETYCASLYLMDQIGVTIMSWTPVEELDAHMKNPAIKYLVLNDSARFNKFYPNHLQDKVILHHRGLIIYKLR